jgi:hypothetical protein
MPLGLSFHGSPLAFAIRIQGVFPDANVEAEGNNGGTVRIIEASSRTKVVEVPQRDLFRKYRWPAADTIQQHLEMFKEEFEK